MNDFANIIKSIKKHDSRISEKLLFFSNVSSGFLSKNIYDQYGLKSIAVCALENE